MMVALETDNLDLNEINMPTKELYLHIGRAKTGTTALQSCLHENRELLAQLGYCFPRTGTGPVPSQAKIALACHHANLASEQVLFALREEFEHEIASFDRIIVSSEGFQNILNTNRLDLFFRKGQSPHTKVAFEYKIKIICYLREFLDYARSAYAQRVQSTSMCCSFPKFCSHFGRFNLNAFLNFWRTFADSVEFRSYEIAAQKVNGVVTDFSEKLGLNLVIGNFAVDSNPTISGNLLIFKLAMNKATPHKVEYYHALARLARAESRFRGPFYISDEVADRLRWEHRNYDEIFRSTVGAYPKKKFSDALPLYDPAYWRDDIERFLAEPEFARLKELQKIREISPNSLTAHDLIGRDNHHGTALTRGKPVLHRGQISS